MDHCLIETKDDPFVFAITTASSFLESTISLYTTNLCEMFDNDHNFCAWLKDAWEPEEAVHGELMRNFVEDTWPDYDWQTSYDEFLKEYQDVCKVELLRPSCCLEMLARCVSETGAALVYKALGDYTQDKRLKQLMLRMYRDEVAHYKKFLSQYQKYNAIEKVGITTLCRTISGRTQLAEKEDFLIAYEHLNGAWRHRPSFELPNYNQFVQQISVIATDFFPFDQASKMLSKPLPTTNWFERMIVYLVQRKIRSHSHSQKTA